MNDSRPNMAEAILRNARLLVVMPHPDDETFSCGGTMARAKALGAKVYVMIMSVGDLNHYRSYDQAEISQRLSELSFKAAREAPWFAEISGEHRLAELESAMERLGVDDYTIIYRDTHWHLRLDAAPRRDLIAQIERESDLSIDRVKPDIIILPAPSYNQDHEATFLAGIAACRPHLPSEKSFVSVVLSADAPQLGWGVESARFNLYVDISDYLDKKLEAHACHQSQLRPEPHHASLANIERLARLRGSEVAVEAAEAFVCHRMLL